MDIKLRPGTPQDAQTCGRICYEAFSTPAGKHYFPPANYVVPLWMLSADPLLTRGRINFQ